MKNYYIDRMRLKPEKVSRLCVYGMISIISYPVRKHDVCPF